MQVSRVYVIVPAIAITNILNILANIPVSLIEPRGRNLPSTERLSRASRYLCKEKLKTAIMGMLGVFARRTACLGSGSDWLSRFLARDHAVALRPNKHAMIT